VGGVTLNSDDYVLDELMNIISHEERELIHSSATFMRLDELLGDSMLSRHFP
jgi:hypothetical protein